MTSNYPHHIDLNEDQDHQALLCTLRSQASCSSIPYFNPFFNHPHEQEGYNYYGDDHHSQHFEPQEEAKVMLNGGSCDHTTQKTKPRIKLKIRKKEERNDPNQMSGESSSSIKWMSPKMRMMNKMRNSFEKSNFEEDKKQRSSSPLDYMDHSVNGSLYSNNNSAIRVCSDCHTTKTPLWRSGPKGPKSLCNACGIRQRKARRAAMAAAAAAVGSGVGEADVAPLPLTIKKINKEQSKNKRRRDNADLSSQVKKCKIRNTKVCQNKTSSSDKLCFDDLRLILSKSSAFQQVFPQDEKEAAILLMALSYGTVHG